MPFLVPDLIKGSAHQRPDSPALYYRDGITSYEGMADLMDRVAGGLRHLGLGRNERVAVFLPKQPETVASLFGAAAAGGAFVPINPHLKPHQVEYILRDCDVRIMVTSSGRASLLAEYLPNCPDLRHIVLTDSDPDRWGGEEKKTRGPHWLGWEALLTGPRVQPARRIDTDLAAILYTSGSTGRPKGVVLSHQNMVMGARSVSSYLENGPEDRLLAVLPLSFDYGLSQLTTAFHSGASAILLDYLAPQDVIKSVVRYGITGLAAVPPLWNQLARLKWPEQAQGNLRYITSSGGAMPRATSFALQESLPNTRIFLMYGLTEAFRSTFLPPGEVSRRPDSIGKPIPNAEIHVVRPDGTECEPNEPGELVHRGPLVALGYWNAPQATRERFRPAPGRPIQLAHPEMAVWSGDQVRRDEEGYLYFVARQDEMIKSSGYRISPTEVEEVAYTYGAIAAAAAFGVPHPILGEAIVLTLEPAGSRPGVEDLKAFFRSQVPHFMVPSSIHVRASLPRNSNGKVDRANLTREFRDLFRKGEGES